jgi:O-antigen/teichoic acid export membrane protein
MGLLYATYTGYFKKAYVHLSQGIEFGLRILPYGLTFSLAACLFLLIASDYLPLILGADFEKSVILIQLLCLHPILRVVMGIGSDILRAINLQGLRVVIMVVSTIAVVPAAWIGLQLGSLNGAVIAGQVVSLIGVLCVWAIVMRKWTGTESKPHSA